MNKKIGIVLLIVAILLFFSNVSFAQEIENKWGIGARVSYYAPNDTMIEGINFNPDTTALFDGNLTYFFNKLFSLEFGVGYTKPDVDAEALGFSQKFGELEQIPITLTGRVHYWFQNSATTLYVGGGVGYYLNDFKLSSAFTTLSPGLRLDADDSFGFHINGGVEFFITDNVALGGDLKYIWNDSDFTAFEPGFPPETVNIDLDAFSAGISIKYFF